MNPTILPSAMGKVVGQTWSFSFVMATSLGEESYEFKPVKPRIKNDLVSHPILADGLVKKYRKNGFYLTANQS